MTTHQPELWEVEHSKAVFKVAIIKLLLPILAVFAHVFALIQIAERPMPWVTEISSQIPPINIAIALFYAAAITYFARGAFNAWRVKRSLTEKC